MKRSKQAGITLIALVITIIILIILAGISIGALTGDNGILNQTKDAKNNTEIAQWEEKIDMVVINIEKEKRNPSLNDIIQGLIDGEIISKEEQVDKKTGAITTNEPSYVIEGKIDDYIPFGPGIIANKKETYEDENGDIAVIPAGFEILEEAEIIEEGLIIQDKDKNQFVWVPVADINDMAQCETAGGTCRLQLQSDGTLKCTTHSSTNIVGKLWATTSKENFGTENTEYNANSGYREPAIVTGDTNGSGNQYDGEYYSSLGYTSASDMLKDFKNQYKKMAESVAKNKGFYIGRYEMSLSTADANSAGTSGTACSKQGVIPTSANNSFTNMWYGLYKIAKTYTVEEDSVESSMIWGSQYDAMLNWVKNGNGADASKVTTVDIGGNYGGTVVSTGNSNFNSDSLNNIRDLGGNLYEWTLEGYYTNFRIIRRWSFLL